ncbi:hypothetical protein ACTXG6_33690 [Pseudonocardia sp. Cha107L01]|uniref:hypothetical protein n=1 Tax=Pseudonocardia sp. Cha107L01 TaxID=3457576 RepID=UPI00403E415E
MALSLSTALVAAGIGAFGVLGAGTAAAATPIAPAAAPVVAPVSLATFTTDGRDFRFCDDWNQRWDDRCFRHDDGDHHGDNRDHHDGHDGRDGRDGRN